MTTERIDVLDGLRGYAVICVFMVHFSAYHYKSEYFSSHDLLFYFIRFFRSHLGVDLFFAISGFLMCLIYFSKDIGFNKFYSMRLVRLAPAYVASVLLYYLYAEFNPTWKWALMFFVCLGAYGFSKSNLIVLFRYFPYAQIVGAISLIVFAAISLDTGSLYKLMANLLFLQYFFHVSSYLHVSWSLVTELLFYTFFFFIKWASIKINVRMAYLLLFSLLFSLFLEYFLSKYMGVSELNVNRYVSFLAGLFLGLITTKIMKMPYIVPKKSPKYMGLVVLVMLILLQQSWIPLLSYFNYTMSIWGYYLVAAIIFFFLLLESMKGDGVLYLLFSNIFFMSVGKVSYSYYLLHPLIIGVTYKALTPVNEAGMFLHLVIAGGVTYIFSCFFYAVLERPYFSKRQLLNERS